MSSRMCIGNVDRCADVVAEVWRRRDEYASRPGHDDLCAAPASAEEEDFMSFTDFGPDFLKQMAPPQSSDRESDSGNTTSRNRSGRNPDRSLAKPMVPNRAFPYHLPQTS